MRPWSASCTGLLCRTACSTLPQVLPVPTLLFFTLLHLHLTSPSPYCMPAVRPEPTPVCRAGNLALQALQQKQMQQPLLQQQQHRLQLQTQPQPAVQPQAQSLPAVTSPRAAQPRALQAALGEARFKSLRRTILEQQVCSQRQQSRLASSTARREALHTS